MGNQKGIMESALIKWRLLLALCCHTAAHSAVPPDYWQQYSKARVFFAKNQLNNALPILEQLEQSKQDYNIELILGDTYSGLGYLPKSLAIYQQALIHGKAANNIVIQRVALFKIARTQLALKQYHKAVLSYQILLSMTLNKADKEIANKGLNNAQHSETTQALTQSESSTQAVNHNNLLQKERQEQFLKTVRHFLDNNEGKNCYDFIKAALYTEPSYPLYMLAAEAMSIMNLPHNALTFYRKALEKSTNDHEKIDALLGIGKMKFWLAHYVAAAKIYNQVVQYHLSGRQYQIALAGLVKSEAYYDRPQKAYQEIPPDLVFNTPGLVVAAAQASLWSGWPDITKNIITNYKFLLTEVNPQASLSKDWRDLTSQTNLATWPNEISPVFFASRDTETFQKQQTVLDYRHYWGYFAQTYLGPEYIKYSQYQSNALEAKGFYLAQTLNLTRNVAIQGKIEPMNFKNLTPSVHSNWNPFLWLATGSFRPNDYVFFNALAQKAVIETFPSFANHITNDQYATTLSIRPLPYLKLDGSYSRLDISDNNVRQGYFFASNLLVSPNYGFSATAVFRGYSNQFKSPNYFSPHQYQERKVVFKLGRKMGASWRYYLDGGFGRQYITSLANTETVSSPTYQWGLGINGPLTKHIFVTFFYVDTHQASAFIDSVDYAYQYGGFSVNILT